MSACDEVAWNYGDVFECDLRAGHRGAHESVRGGFIYTWGAPA